MPIQKLDAYLTIKEAAALLGVSPNTLRNWGRCGKVKMHRHPVNDYRLFLRADLEALLERTAQPEADISSGGKAK